MPWTTVEFVNCGKNCTGCPHGPYIYDWERDKKGRPRKTYRGKAHPTQQADIAALHQMKPDDILHPKKATVAIALKILHLPRRPTPTDLATMKRHILKNLHPDHGGNAHEFTLASAALSFLAHAPP